MMTKPQKENSLEGKKYVTFEGFFKVYC